MNALNKVLIPALVPILIAGCGKEESFEEGGRLLRIRFVAMANGEPLSVGKQYLNPLGEDYRVGTFKIYVTNLSLMDESSTPVSSAAECFHLLDASDPATLVIDHRFNEKPFTRIRLQVGIDSLRNVSGAQTGALDPMKGMFWTWSTGYINAKLEGSSFFSPNPDRSFVYHIGGFAGEERTQREVLLDLPGNGTWTLDEDGVSEAVVNIDLDGWFRSRHDMPIAQHPVSMTPGPTAVRYADNYAEMFQLESLSRK